MDAIETVDDNDISQEYVVALCEGRCSEELVVTYRKILKTFYNANYTAHLDELETLYAAHNDHNVDVTELVPMIDSILRMAGDRALSALLIELDHDIPIDMYAEVLDILLGFDPTDTPEILMNAVENTDDDVEGLCKLLEFLGTYEIDDLIPYIANVDRRFTDNLKRTLQQAVDNAEVDMTPPAQMENLRRMSRLVSLKDGTLGAELVRMKSASGASMESLYAVYVPRLIDATMESAIEEIYSLATFSCESFEAAERAVGASLDDLYYEIDSRRKAEQLRRDIGLSYKTVYGENHG